MQLWIILGIIAIVLTLMIAYSMFIEIKWYEITHPELYIHGLDATFDGYKIAQITDIHMDSSMTRERLIRIAGMIDEQKPDLIVITGDFVSYNVEYVTNDLRDALSEYSAPHGIIAVTGNHDYLSGVDRVRGVLNDVGIHELANDYKAIERDNARFYVAGIDDVSAKKSRLDILLNKLPDDAPAILLAHEPDFADIAAATGRFAVQLSGHTHGGQIQMPFIGAFYGPKHGHIYQDGMYDVDDGLQIYVSRGVGTVTLPIRFNCRPEITILTLRSITNN